MLVLAIPSCMGAGICELSSVFTPTVYCNINSTYDFTNRPPISITTLYEVTPCNFQALDIGPNGLITNAVIYANFTLQIPDRCQVGYEASIFGFVAGRLSNVTIHGSITLNYQNIGQTATYYLAAFGLFENVNSVGTHLENVSSGISFFEGTVLLKNECDRDVPRKYCIYTDLERLAVDIVNAAGELDRGIYDVARVNSMNVLTPVAYVADHHYIETELMAAYRHAMQIRTLITNTPSIQTIRERIFFTPNYSVIVDLASGDVNLCHQYYDADEGGCSATPTQNILLQGSLVTVMMCPTGSIQYDNFCNFTIDFASGYSFDVQTWSFQECPPGQKGSLYGCVSSCDNFNFTYRESCVDACESGLEVNEASKQCYDAVQCQDGKVLFEDRRCIDICQNPYVVLEQKCVENCSQSLRVVEVMSQNQWCHEGSACPSGKAKYQQFCLEICPDNLLNKSGQCIQQGTSCNDGLVANILANNCTECASSHAGGSFWSRAQKQCVQACEYYNISIVDDVALNYCEEYDVSKPHCRSVHIRLVNGTYIKVCDTIPCNSEYTLNSERYCASCPQGYMFTYEDDHFYCRQTEQNGNCGDEYLISPVAAQIQVCVKKCRDIINFCSSLNNVSAAPEICNQSNENLVYVNEGHCVARCSDTANRFLDSAMEQCQGSCPQNQYATVIDTSTGQTVDQCFVCDQSDEYDGFYYIEQGLQRCTRCDQPYEYKHSDKVCNTTSCQSETTAIYDDNRKCVEQCSVVNIPDELQCGQTCAFAYFVYENKKYCALTEEDCKKQFPNHNTSFVLDMDEGIRDINGNIIPKCATSCKSSQEFVYDGNKCASVCPHARYSVDQDTGRKQCVDACPDLYFVITKDKKHGECLLQCPETHLYRIPENNAGQEVQCVENCFLQDNNATYVFGETDSQCVRSCVSGFYVSIPAGSNNLVCVDTCSGPNLFYADNETFSDSKKFIDNGITETYQCVTNCSENFVRKRYSTNYNGMNMCVEFCPPEQPRYDEQQFKCDHQCYYEEDNGRLNCIAKASCAGKIVDETKQCLEDCPAGSSFVYENVCYKKCPHYAGFVLDGTNCVTICPDDKRFINERNECVAKCEDDQFYSVTGQENHCIDTCAAPNFVVQETRQCIAHCPDGFGYVTGLECSSACPEINGIRTYRIINDTHRECLQDCQHMYEINEGDKICIRDCQESHFNNPIQTGPQQCGKECTGTQVIQNGVCRDNCDPNYAVSLDGKRCDGLCNYRTDEGDGTRRCMATPCAHDSEYRYYVYITGTQYECVKTCNTTFVDQYNVCLQSTGCPYYFLNESSGQNTCLGACPAEYYRDDAASFGNAIRCEPTCKNFQSRPYHELSATGYRTCVQSCSLPYVDEGNMCLGECSASTHYISHDGSTCLAKCPYIADRGYYIRPTGHRQCIPQCGSSQYVTQQAQNERLECSSNCSDQGYVYFALQQIQYCVQSTCSEVSQRQTFNGINVYRQLQFQSGRECVAQCPRYYEERDGERVCVDACSSKAFEFDQNGAAKCVPQCPGLFMDNIQYGGHVQCVSTCSTHQYQHLTNECSATKCDDYYHLDTKSNVYICKLSCEEDEFISSQDDRLCQNQCEEGELRYKNADGQTVCLASKSCPSGKYLYHGIGSALQCLDTCPAQYFADGNECRQGCQSGMFVEEAGGALRCVASTHACDHYLSISSNLRQCLANCDGLLQSDTVGLPRQCFTHQQCSDRNMFVSGTVCAGGCDSALYKIQDGRYYCQESCPFNATQVPIFGHAYFMCNDYEEMCTGALVPYDRGVSTALGKCAARCPSGMYYSINLGICEHDCQHNYFFTDNQLLHNVCVSKCDHYQYTVETANVDANGKVECKQLCAEEFFYGTVRCMNDITEENCCVTKCPPQTYLQNGQECVESCKFIIDEEAHGGPACVTECASFYIIRQSDGLPQCQSFCSHLVTITELGRLCSESCPGGYYQQGKQCVLECDSGTVEENTCVGSCSYQYQYQIGAQIFCTASCGVAPNQLIYAEGKWCQRQCTPTLFIYDNQGQLGCVEQCPQGYKIDTNGNTMPYRCDSACYYQIKDGLAICMPEKDRCLLDGVELFKNITQMGVQCVEQCLHFSSAGTCVNECDTHLYMVDNDTGSKYCVSNCPDGMVLGYDEKYSSAAMRCAPSCNDYKTNNILQPDEVGGKHQCVSSCRTGYYIQEVADQMMCVASCMFYHIDGKSCVTECPAAETFVDSDGRRICFAECDGYAYVEKSAVSQQYNILCAETCDTAINNAFERICTNIPCKQLSTQCGPSYCGNTQSGLRFNMNGVCRETCGGMMAESRGDEYVCVADCDTHVIKNVAGASICHGQCDGPYFLNGSYVQCITSCPEDATMEELGLIYLHGNECSTIECKMDPVLPYDDGQHRCVSQCPQDQFLEAGRCVESCSIFQTFDVINGNNICGTCSRYISGTAQKNGIMQCVDSCQGFIDNGICRDSCSSKYYVVQADGSKLCQYECSMYEIDSYGLYKCISMCPEGMVLVDRLCTTQCTQQLNYAVPGGVKDKFVFKCVSQCPYTLPYYYRGSGNNFYHCQSSCNNSFVPDKGDNRLFHCLSDGETCASLSYQLSDRETSMCLTECNASYHTQIRDECVAMCLYYQNTTNKVCTTRCGDQNDQIYDGTGAQIDVTQNIYVNDETRECVTACGHMARYQDSDGVTHCTTRCPDAMPYEDSLQCVAQCATMVVEDGTCKQQCTPAQTDGIVYYRLDSVIMGQKICLSECTGLFIEHSATERECVDVCPSDLPFLLNKQCREDCNGLQADQTFVCTTMECSDAKYHYVMNGTAVCNLDGCPAGYPYTTSTKECLVQCKAHDYTNEPTKQCVSSCALIGLLNNDSARQCTDSCLHYIDQDGTKVCIDEPSCAQTSHAYQVEGTDLCTNQCDDAHFLEGDKCVVSCHSTVYYRIDGGMKKCLPNCPSTSYFGIDSSHHQTLYRCEDSCSVFTQPNYKSTNELQQLVCSRVCTNGRYLYENEGMCNYCNTTQTERCYYVEDGYNKVYQGQCPQNTTAVGHRCETSKCPDGEYLNYDNSCRTECLYPYLYHYSNKTCTGRCTDPKEPYLDAITKQCVEQCESGCYEVSSLGNVCVNACEYYVADQNAQKRCYKSCFDTGDHLYLISGSTECTSKCASGYFTNYTHRLCQTTCYNHTRQDADAGTCSSSCTYYTDPNDHQEKCISTGTSCKDMITPQYNYLYGEQCLAECPSDTFSQDMICVDECRRINNIQYYMLIDGKKVCQMQPCQLFYIETVPSVYECCDKCPENDAYSGYNYKKRCISGRCGLPSDASTSLTPYLVNGTKECLEQCPVGWYIRSETEWVCLDIKSCSDPRLGYDGYKINEDGVRYCVERCLFFVFDTKGEKRCYEQCPIINGVQLLADDSGECRQQSCGSQQYIENTKCVDRCTYFLEADGQLCVDGCQNYYFEQVNGNAVCVEDASTCRYYAEVLRQIPGGEATYWECLAVCQIVSAYNDRLCRPDCPKIYQTADGTELCYDQCSDTNRPYLDGKYCVDACPPNSFLVDEFTCTRDCNKSYINVTDQLVYCQDTCDIYTYHSQQYPGKIVCVAQCPDDLVVYERQCQQDCPVGYQFIEGRTCQRQCSDTSVFVDFSDTGRIYCKQDCDQKLFIREGNMQICQTQCSGLRRMQNYYKDVAMCVSSCVEGYLSYGDDLCIKPAECEHYIHQTAMACVESCGNMFIENPYSRHCVDSCGDTYYQPYGDQKLCIQKCSADYPYVAGSGSQQCVHTCDQYIEYTKGLAMCVVSCDAMTQDGVCVQQCTYPLAFTQGRTCVRQCGENETYTINKVCIQCDGYIYENQCLENCPTEAPFVDERKCVSSCPQYIQHKQCVRQCAGNHIMIDNVCMQTLTPCTERYYLLDDKLDILRCTDNCSPPYVQYGNQLCLQHCHGYFYNEQCIDECPRNAGYNRDRKCVVAPSTKEYYYAHNMTVTACEEAPYLRNNATRACTLVCQDNYVRHGRDCMQRCPYGYYNQDQECVQKCAVDHYYNEPTRECLKQCLTQTYEGQFCVKNCSMFFYTIGNSRYCISACPSYSLASGECVAHCAQYTVNEAGQRICGAQCTKYYYKHPDGARECVDECKPEQFLTDGAECVDSCKFFVNEDQECVAACPWLYQTYNGMHYCTDHCDITAQFLDKGKCQDLALARCPFLTVRFVNGTFFNLCADDCDDGEVVQHSGQRWCRPRGCAVLHWQNMCATTCAGKGWRHTAMGLLLCYRECDTFTSEDLSRCEASCATGFFQRDGGQLVCRGRCETYVVDGRSGLKRCEACAASDAAGLCLESCRAAGKYLNTSHGACQDTCDAYVNSTARDDHCQAGCDRFADGSRCVERCPTGYSYMGRCVARCSGTQLVLEDRTCVDGCGGGYYQPATMQCVQVCNGFIQDELHCVQQCDSLIHDQDGKCLHECSGGFLLQQTCYADVMDPVAVCDKKHYNVDYGTCVDACEYFYRGTTACLGSCWGYHVGTRCGYDRCPEPLTSDGFACLENSMTTTKLAIICTVTIICALLVVALSVGLALRCSRAKKMLRLRRLAQATNYYSQRFAQRAQTIECARASRAVPIPNKPAPAARTRRAAVANLVASARSSTTGSERHGVNVRGQRSYNRRRIPADDVL